MKVFFRACLIAFAGLVVYSMVTHWLAWRFSMGDWPVPQGTPWTYQLESGFIPALTVLTLLGTVAGAWHSVNCHEPKCWRIGKHKVDGTPWCNAHHEHARTQTQAGLEAVVAELTEIKGLLKKIAGQAK